MTVGEVKAKLVLDLSNFRSGLERANTLLERSREVAARTGVMLAGFGAAIATGLVTVTKKAAEFEAEMRNVNSILKVSEGEFAALSKSVLALAGKTGKGPAELARGLYDIASSGFSGAEGLQILEASAIAATAGMTDVATAAKAGTAVLNAYGMEASEIGRVQDVLFRTVDRGVVTYGELAMNLGDVVATAAQAKVPIEEIGAAIAAMTKAGVQAPEAVTSLNQVMLSFIKPTDQAKAAAAALGVDLTATALASKGLSGVIVDLAQKIGTSAVEMDALAQAGASEAEIMEMIARQAGMTSEQLAELFPNIRALRGVLVLAADGARVFSEEVMAMADATGAAASAFAEQGKSFRVQWQKTWATVQAAMVRFGASALPILKLLTTALREVVAASEVLPGPLRSIVFAAAALTAAFALLTAAFIAWTVMLGDTTVLSLGMLGAMRQMTAAAIAAAAGTNVLTAAWLLLKGAIVGTFKVLLANPFTALILLVGALATTLISAFARGRSKVQELNDELRETQKRLAAVGKAIPKALRQRLEAAPEPGWWDKLKLGMGISTGKFEDYRVAVAEYGMYARAVLDTETVAREAVEDAARKLHEFRMGATNAEIEAIEKRTDAEIEAIEKSQDAALSSADQKAEAIAQVNAAAELEIAQARKAGTAEAIRAQIQLLEAQGKSHEARLLQIRQESEAVAAAAYPDPKDEPRRARAQAVMYMAEMEKLEREAAEERARIYEQEVTKRVSDWADAAQQMYEAETISAGEYVELLSRMAEALRRVNEERRAAGEEPFEEVESRRLQIEKAALQERGRLLEQLNRAEGRLHEERMEWTEQERAARASLYEHEMSLLDLTRRYALDMLKMRGEDTEEALGEIERQYLSDLAAARPAEDLGPEQMSAWAERMRQATIGAWEGGLISQEEALERLTEARDAATAATEAAAEADKAAFEARRTQHEQAMAMLSAEQKELGGYIERATTALADIFKGMADSADALRRAASGALQSRPLALAAAGWGRIASEGAGGQRTINFYYHGQKATPSATVAQLLEAAADELEREHRHPRD